MTTAATHTPQPARCGGQTALTLRPYQHKLRDDAGAAFNAGHRQVLAVAPTGAGKTVTFIDIATRAIARQNRVCLLMHRGELIRQTSKALGDFPHGIIQAGHPPLRHLPLQIASVQTLVRRLDRYRGGHGFDLIIVDECFPAGTLIDGKPIEQIQPGDMVNSLNMTTGQIEKKRVVRLFKNQAPRKLIAIHVWGGVVFTCTENHPIFVAGRGWIAAKEINDGDILIANGDANVPIQEHMRGMRDSIREAQQSEDLRESLFEHSAQIPYAHSGSSVHSVRHDENGSNETGTSDAREGAGLLLEGMQDHSSSGEIVRSNGCDESKVCQRADESKQSDEQSRDEIEGGKYAKGNWPQAEDSGRQWTPDDGAATAAFGSAWMADGTGSQVPRYEVEQSENRYCKQGDDDCNRGGRKQPLLALTTGAGPGEGRGIAFARVDRVEVQECGSADGSGSLCSDGHVYNFEVEDNNNYFVNGFLVHNCHHTTARTYMQILEVYPFARVLGVTATPIRADGRGLRDAGYTAMVQGPTVRWLTDAGYLSPAHVYAPGGIDVADVKTTAGEFNRGQLAAVTDRPVITGNAIEHYRRYADRQPAIAFCVSVEHAEHVAELFREAGYSAASIDGKKSDHERARLIGALGTGELNVLTSCDLISEGVDVPVVSCGIMLRPTQSKALWMQQMGRCLRPAQGKSHAVILDHAGNSRRLECLPDTDHEWSLDAPKVCSKGEPDPDVVTVRRCAQCLRSHVARPVCPFCGYVYPLQSRTVDEVAGELELLDAAYEAAGRKAEEWACKTLEDYQRVAAERGYQPGWAWHRWQAKQRKSA